MKFPVVVEVMLRPGIADPQGATVERALPALGFAGVEGVRVGKAIRFTVDAADEGDARTRVEQLCERFLTNPVIEEAEMAREEGTERVILFGLCGHGHFDLSAYDAYLAGELADPEFSSDEMDEALARLPRAPALA